MMTAPAAPSGLVRTKRATTPAAVSFGARVAEAVPWATSMLVAMASAVADTRVEPRVGQVDQQVDDDEPEGDEEDQRLHHWIVAVGDRVDHEPADAVQGEHGLGDHGPADKERELCPDERDDREHRVLERVPDDDRAL